MFDKRTTNLITTKRMNDKDRLRVLRELFCAKDCKMVALANMYRETQGEAKAQAAIRLTMVRYEREEISNRMMELEKRILP